MDALRWLVRFLPSPVPRTEARASIWSVRAEDARTFFRIAGALWLVALGRIGYNMGGQWAAPPDRWWGAADFALAVAGGFSDMGAGLAMVAMLLTRPVNVMGGVTMSLANSVYQAMVNRYVIPVIEKHKAEGRVEGRAQGRAEGRAEGREGEREQWLAWNRRRIDAERRGQKFEESPPGI